MNRQQIANGKGFKQRKKLPVVLEEVLETKSDSLQRLNVIASLLHLLIAILVASLGNHKLDLQFFVMNIETLNREEGDWIVFPQTNSKVVQLNLIAAIVVFESFSLRSFILETDSFGKSFMMKT